MEVLTASPHVTDSWIQNPVSQTVALIFGFSIVLLINYGGDSFSQFFKLCFLQFFSDRCPVLIPVATNTTKKIPNFFTCLDR